MNCIQCKCTLKGHWTLLCVLLDCCRITTTCCVLVWVCMCVHRVVEFTDTHVKSNSLSPSAFHLYQFTCWLCYHLLELHSSLVRLLTFACIERLHVENFSSRLSKITATFPQCCVSQTNPSLLVDVSVLLWIRSFQRLTALSLPSLSNTSHCVDLQKESRLRSSSRSGLPFIMTPLSVWAWSWRA